MEKMGFCSQWRNLVMGCIKPLDFVVIMNEQPERKFNPSRGICQGDPLSPYLFILLSEVFPRLIQLAVDRQQLTGISMNPGYPVISHMFFADDTLFFFRVDKQNCGNLMKIIDAYCIASGQKVNVQKSYVFFGANLPRCFSAELSHVLGVPIVDNPGKYLGLPSF
ncbi:hypothetical protein ACFX2H_013271 [Malus domestica]